MPGGDELTSSLPVEPELSVLLCWLGAGGGSHEHIVDERSIDHVEVDMEKWHLLEDDMNVSPAPRLEESWQL